ncbi:hypothetical protein [Corynebacterium kalidii]
MAVNPDDPAAGAATPGDGAFDADALVARVDALLASDATGPEEAELLEQAHHLINDAMEGR